MEPEPAEMDTEGDRWARTGGLLEEEELDTALARLVELAARVSLRSRETEPWEGSMAGSERYRPRDRRYAIAILGGGLLVTDRRVFGERVRIERECDDEMRGGKFARRERERLRVGKLKVDGAEQRRWSERRRLKGRALSSVVRKIEGVRRHKTIRQGVGRVSPG